MTVDKESYIHTRTHCMDLNDNDHPVQSLDLSGSIIDVSPAWIKLTGYEKEEVLGRHFIEFLHADSVLTCLDYSFPHLKDFGYVDHVPFKIRTKDNKAIPVILDGTSKYRDDGSFERTFCVLTVIKE